MRPFLVISLLLISAVGQARGAINLIVNGDFEDASLAGGVPIHPGINSDYLHTPNGNFDEGTWWAYPDAGSPWYPVQHTPGGLGAMNVNGADSGTDPNPGSLRVWYQNVSVVSGQLYNFESWALATRASGGYSLEYRFNGNVVGTQLPVLDTTWEQFNYQYLATSNSVAIAIYDIAGNTFPNDFMLDDISLTAANASVPEPTSLTLWGLGALGCAIAGYRRRNAA